MPKIAAVLLAAGRSERMGEQKALLPWDRDTLLAYQLRQLASIPEVDDIIVVTGYRAELLGPIVAAVPKARAVHNAGYAGGKSTSVRCGADAVRDDATAVLVLGVDQPRPASLHASLIAAHAAHGAAITAPLLDGHRGHPLIFDRALLPELRAVEEATLGVRAIVERHATDVYDVPVDDPSACIDLNTPADVERARAALGVRA